MNSRSMFRRSFPHLKSMLLAEALSMVLMAK